MKTKVGVEARVCSNKTTRAINCQPNIGSYTPIRLVNLKDHGMDLKLYQSLSKRFVRLFTFFSSPTNDAMPIIC